jgi:ATP-binding protein involved in chromosome partitioning
VQTGQRVAGVIENMSWLELPDGGRLELFGEGGGRTVAARLSATLGTVVPLLGSIPLDVRLRQGGDAGVPVVLGEGPSLARQELDGIADVLAHRPRGLDGLRLPVTPR